MKKTFITRATLTVAIIEKMIDELQFLREDVQNHVFPFREPPQEVTTLEESIKFSAKDILEKVESYAVIETLSSISDDEIVQIY